jgi:3,4-dihydroxy 2-butanone 4-phosphate synthase / GTP cyclohydrolase II
LYFFFFFMAQFAGISEVLHDLHEGKMVIVVDDEDRENEGDLVMAAECMTPEAMGFIIRHTGGVVCLCMTNTRADELQLPAMVRNNESNRETGFTVSIEAASGVTTGISAADRCATVLAASDLESQARDLVRPGHIFPLRARDGGVLVRVGHTEASVDLCRLAGLQPMGVVSELVNDDGSVQKGEQLFAFAKEHGLKICSVGDIVKYRLALGDTKVSEMGAKNDESELMASMVSCEAESKLETRFGEFDLQVYRDHVNGREHVVLKSQIPNYKSQTHSKSQMSNNHIFDEPVLVRVHSECLTGEVFGSTFCDCGGQLELAMEMMAKEGGVLLYLRQEGRGIGLANKIRAYDLQSKGLDTVEANEKLGFKADLREYGIGAQILRDVGVTKMRMLTNNPRKIVGLEGYGLEVVEQIPLISEMTSERGKRYMEAKRSRMGHLIEEVVGEMVKK